MPETTETLDGQDKGYVVGQAALSLLEALILTLQDRELLQSDEIDDAFMAAIVAHRNHKPDSGEETCVQSRIVDLLERLRVQGNSVRL